MGQIFVLRDDGDAARAAQYSCNFLLVRWGSNKLVFGIVICFPHILKDICQLELTLFLDLFGQVDFFSFITRESISGTLNSLDSIYISTLILVS